MNPLATELANYTNLKLDLLNSIRIAFWEIRLILVYSKEDIFPMGGEDEVLMKSYCVKNKKKNGSFS